MDGNGRWAKQRNLPRAMGHKAGVEVIRNIVKECNRLGIKYLTLYAFSTENWKRPKEEVSTLMSLLVTYLKNVGHHRLPRLLRVLVEGQDHRDRALAEPRPRDLRPARRRRHGVLHDPADADDLLRQGALGARRAP